MLLLSALVLFFCFNFAFIIHFLFYLCYVLVFFPSLPLLSCTSTPSPSPSSLLSDSIFLYIRVCFSVLGVDGYNPSAPQYDVADKGEKAR